MGATDRFTGIIEAKTVGEQDLQRFTSALDKVSTSLDKSGQKANEHKSSFDKFAAGVKDAVQNPLQAAGNAAESFLTKLGPVGVGVSVAAATMTAFGTAAFSAAKSLGEYGDRIGDIAVRTGLTVKEVGEFSFAMKRAGGDISGIETSMRMLSRGLADTGEEGKKAREAIATMVPHARNLDGSLRPTSEILLAMSEHLAGMTDTAKRNTLAMNAMGRGALEVLPDLLELAEGVKRAKELGLAPTEAEVAKWNEYHKQVTDFEAMWDKMVRDMVKKPLVATVEIITKGFKASSAPGGSGGTLYGDTWVEAVRQWMLGNTGDVAGPTAPGMSQKGISLMEASERARGQAIIASAVASQSGTKEGAQRLLSAAQARESSAWTALSGSEGLGEAKVLELRDAWQKARAEAAKYKAQLDAINEAEKSAKQLAELGARGWTGIRYRQMLSGIGGTDAVGTEGMKSLPVSDNLRSQSESFMKYRQQWAKEDEEAESEVQKLLKADDQIRERSQKSQLDHQLRMIDLLSGPGGEISAIQQIYELRVRSAKTTEEAQEAEYQRTESLLALHKQQVEQYVSLVQGATNALLAGGGGLGSFLKGQGTGMISQIAGNAARMSYSAIDKFFPNAKEGTLLGDLLAGTPFGADPLKAATEDNTKATIANTRAIAGLALSRTGGGGGSIGGLYGEGSELASILGIQIPGGSGGTTTLSEADELASLNKVGKGGWGRNLIGVGALAGGGLGVYSGIRSGGARGAATALGSAAGGVGAAISAGLFGAGAAAGPAAPILMGVGLAMGMITSLFGDPKQKRAEEMSSFMDSHRYEGPDPVSSTVDMYGRGVGYDFRGNMRPIINYNGPVIQGDVHAMDSGSFETFLDKHPAELNRGVAKAIDVGGAMVPKLQQQMGLV